MTDSAALLMAERKARGELHNLEPLLATISSEYPAGENLRYDPLYDRIRQARLAEDDALPQGVWQRATQQPDWRLVEQLTTDAIMHRSKDLQLAVWLTEALLHLYGMQGFIVGCDLLYSFHGSYPRDMHPSDEVLRANAPAIGQELPLPIDSPSVEARANLIQWINEKLAVQLKLLPLSAPREISGAMSYSLADLESARLLEQHREPPSHPNRIKLFEESLSMTPIEWLLQLWNEVQQAIEATQCLDAMLDCVYGKANGGLMQIKHVLKSMASTIASVLPPEDFAPDEPGRDDAELTFASTAHEYTPQPSQADEGPIRSATGLSRDISMQVRTREDAYQALSYVAAFLANLEPHSPVPYLLRRAIAWGGMSLEELLPEILRDGPVLSDVSMLLRLPRSDRKST
jgi:type VI secretion system protein ImpA